LGSALDLFLSLLESVDKGLIEISNNNPFKFGLAPESINQLAKALILIA
jgi:hypothetical protein